MIKIAEKFKQDISIGENLKRLRLNAGYTQESLAVKLQTLGFDISREIISQMELGKYSIRISIFIQLKKLYNISYDEFFEELE